MSALGKSIVRAGTGCVGDIVVEVFEPTDAPGEYILDVQRGGLPESQFTRGDLDTIYNALGLFFAKTRKATR